MKTVFFDVDTQLDFICPAGALAVPGAERIVEALAKLTQFAASKHIQIVSTTDAHSEDDPEFKSWKPHCVTGTTGQQKLAGTLLTGADPSQIIFEKQEIDVFQNPRIRPLLDKLKADRYVVYGVVTEYCVRSAALGLLQTGAQVQLVTDAIKSLKTSDEQQFFEDFRARGGLTMKCDDVLAGR